MRRDSSGGTRLLCHPVVGDLALERSTLACADDPEQQLVVWTANPGSPSHDALRPLASHPATRAAAAAG
nr:hypothetical protein [Streptomyces sp. 846.5]